MSGGIQPGLGWARHASVLLIASVRSGFERNDKPNRHAHHDLGLALGNLSLEATARGLSVHQMAGFDPDRVRELYGVPQGFEPLTAVAVGYAADPSTLDETVRERDTSSRRRKPLDEIVFHGTWGSTAPVVTS